MSFLSDMAPQLADLTVVFGALTTAAFLAGMPLILGLVTSRRALEAAGPVAAP